MRSRSRSRARHRAVSNCSSSRMELNGVPISREYVTHMHLPGRRRKRRKRLSILLTNDVFQTNTLWRGEREGRRRNPRKARRIHPGRIPDYQIHGRPGGDRGRSGRGHLQRRGRPRHCRFPEGDDDDHQRRNLESAAGCPATRTHDQSPAELFFCRSYSTAPIAGRQDRIANHWEDDADARASCDTTDGAAEGFPCMTLHKFYFIGLGSQGKVIGFSFFWTMRRCAG